MSATNINRVILTGNLTADPELRATPAGTQVKTAKPRSSDCENFGSLAFCGGFFFPGRLRLSPELSLTISHSSE